MLSLQKGGFGRPFRFTYFIVSMAGLDPAIQGRFEYRRSKAASDCMADKPFQRIGAISNAHAGADFEALAQDFFLRAENLNLIRDFDVLVGAHSHKKQRRFDLGCKAPATLIECKSHKWTSGNNIPSAKITVWNESMYYFHLAPAEYRKILFVLKDMHSRRGESLAAYYIRNYGHLIPAAVEIWEHDLMLGQAVRIH